MISSAIDPSAVARATGVKTIFKNLLAGVVLLPQRVALFAQGATDGTFLLTKQQFFSAFAVGQEYGFGTPAHLAAKQLLPANNDGIGSIPFTVYPLADGTTASVGDIGAADGPATSEQTYIVKVNEIPSEIIVVPKDATPAAAVALFVAGINANVEMPVIASDGTTKVDLVAKWKGESGDDLIVEIEGVAAGITYTITQPTGGAGNPDVQDALNQIGGVWETLIVNCLNISDTVNLEKYSVFGEGRWQPIEPKPLLVFTGNTEANVATAVTVPDSRKTDRVNSQLVAPGSKELPFVIAARQVARIAKLANNNPPTDYAGQFATGVVPGTDLQQWVYTQRDSAVKAGSSTIEVTDSVIEMSDTVTFHHPSGDPTPAWRYVVDVIKEMNVVFNLRLIFESPDWKGKILIPSGQATTNPNARRPSTAIAAVAKMFDSLALNAIISDPEAAKSSIVAGINPTNPKRLDLSATHQLSGNTNQIAIDNNFGFYFGTQAAA